MKPGQEAPTLSNMIDSVTLQKASPKINKKGNTLWFSARDKGVRTSDDASEK